MPVYVALLRGIGPTNPNMRNAKLREVFESLGFSDVRSVISSGNIIFTTPKADVVQLQTKIEQALSEKLGLKNSVILRSQDQLQKLVDDDTFAQLAHAPKTYLTVTFLKDVPPKGPMATPETSSVIKKIDRKAGVIFAITDTTASKTPDFMAWLERQFGKEITTRTFKTVERILKKMAA